MNPMWMILASLAAVAALAAVFTLQRIAARRRVAKDPLPPMCTTDQHRTQPGRVQVLSRDSLVNPDRRLDVHAWDNTPDAGAPADLDGTMQAEPLVLDRNFLANRGLPSEGPGG